MNGISAAQHKALPDQQAAAATQYSVAPPGSDSIVTPGNKPIAIFVAHGMGQQIPFETLDAIAESLRAYDATLTKRTDKPIATGAISVSTVRASAIACAALSIALTVPLGWPAFVVHLVVLVSAWLYNAWLKNTALSVAPFVVSFGMGFPKLAMEAGMFAILAQIRVVRVVVTGIAPAIAATIATVVAIAAVPIAITAVAAAEA